MLVSIRQLSDLTGLDRETVTRRLKSLPSTDGPNRAKLFESTDAFPLLYAGDKAVRQDEKESLTEARTNESNAKARKTWIEVEVLEKKRIPLEVFHPTLDEFLGGIAATLKQAKLPAALLEEIGAGLRDLPRRLNW